MEQKRLKFPIAAPFFILAALMNLVDISSTGSIIGALATFLSMGVCIAMAVFQFMQRRDILPVCGGAAMAVVTLLNVLANVIGFFHLISYGGGAQILLNLSNGFTLLLTLVGYLAVAVVVLVCIPKPDFIKFDYSKYEGMVKKFWFAPAALLLVAHAIGCFLTLVFYGLMGYLYGAMILRLFGVFVRGVIMILPWFLLCMWVRDPEDKRPVPAVKTIPAVQPAAAAETAAEQETAVPQQTAAAPQTGRLPIDAGHIDMILHIILLIFVGPIWRYFWIYKTTESLNGIPGEKDRNVLLELVLCLFVPFYWWYWIYASCKRIDQLAGMRGIQSDITILCVVLEICVGVITPAIMQDKINTIIKAGETAAV